MKIRFLPICASSALLLAGCVVEEAPMEGGSIAAVMEDIHTRTAVTDEGTFTWSAGDQVWLEITANPGYVTGTLSSGAGTGSANFSYGTYFGDMTGKAVYPFNSGHDVNGDELSVVLPASYDLGTNLSNTNAAMYGVETGGNIKFNHLAGVMRFKFRNAPAGTDRFILTLDKKINGTFTADLTEDHPVLRTESASSASEKSITLNFDPLTSAQDIMLYVPLPLGTYTTLGLEVKAGSQSVWSYSNTVTNTINRKSLILMPTVTLAGSINGDIEGSDDTVNLSESGTANSYIVSEAGSYKFTPAKGNSSESVGAISSAEVLWETFGTDETPSVGSLISEVSYEDGNIIFSTPESFREGNAVIAAKNASGNILWSWHIWLTDQPEEQVYYNNAGTMMDRNLGATSTTPGDVGALGLLYQWGRKDPFLGSSSISDNIEAKSTITWPSAISSSVSVGTVDYVTANPTTFIMSSSADWCYSSPDNTLWQSEKSVYDPCPSGWRVSDGGTDGVWAKALGLYGSSTGYPYDLNNEGINFSDYLGDDDVIWYPAPGYRSPSDGAIVQVGFYCYAFSTTPELTNNGISAKAMMLDETGYINPVSYMGKAHASVVRCFKEGSGCSVPEEPSEPEDPSPSQPSYSVQLNPSTYGWVQSSTVSNPDASLYDGVYESTNQGMSSTKSIMYIDIDGYDTFTFYVRSYAESQYDYVVVSNLDVDITSSTSDFKMTTSGNQQSGTSLSSYTEVTFTNIGGGQHRIMVAYKKDHSVDNGNDKGYVLIPKNQNQTSQTPSATDLSSNGTANSYIVSEAGSYKFTPTKGNSSTSVGAITSVEVLWETFGTDETPNAGSLVSEARYEDGSIAFSTPESFRKGNAVIAAKDANGTILWSWHIWLTDEPEEQIYYNNAGTMMDRNLGAISATPGDVGALGLLYQWGRKDPFLSGSSIYSDNEEAKSTITWPLAVSSNSSNGTIDYATKHPTTFIGYNSDNWDWYYTGSDLTDKTRWQSEKTIYDPCPSGWRVPDGDRNGVWSTSFGSSSASFTDIFNFINAGIDFSCQFGEAINIWYPASGIRDYDDCSLNGVGNYGGYWSVSLSGRSACRLFFNGNSGYFGPADNYGGWRANAYSVRCARES